MDEQKVAQTVNRSGQSTKLGKVLINEKSISRNVLHAKVIIINENMEGQKNRHSKNNIKLL